MAVKNRRVFKNLDIIGRDDDDDILEKVDKLVDLVRQIMHFRTRSMFAMQTLPPHRIDDYRLNSLDVYEPVVT